MTSISFIRTITELQVGLLTKNNIIYCKKTNISSKICSFLLQQELIYKYIIKGSKYEVWPKSLRNLRLIKRLYLISRPGLKKYYSLYKIKTLMWKNKNYIYLISAPSATRIKNIPVAGFINQLQAVTLNTGGEVLLKIETM